MSRNLIVTIVVMILIVAAGGIYISMNKQQTSPTAPSENTEASAQPTPVVEKTSLKNFMSMQGTQKCDFTDPDSGNSGVVFMDSGKFRGNFSANTGGKATMTHMINDGKNAYIWMDDQPTGFKTTVEAVEQMSSQTGVSQSVDINKQVDYKCASWESDPDKFIVPGDKKFTDMSKMMEDAMKRMPSVSPNASITPQDNVESCLVCDGLESDAKAQCKKALKCS
jgi:hypothetical protein